MCTNRPISEIRNQLFYNVENDDDGFRRVKRDFCSAPLDEKVLFAYGLLEENGLLPNCRVKSKKCANSATEFRTRGNQAFCRNQLSIALNLYSASVRLSLPNSLELSLAYANRSAVFFEYEKFDLCLLDINRALDTNYPENLRYKLYHRKGKCLHKIGSYFEAELSLQNSRHYLRHAEITPEQRYFWEKQLDELMEICNECYQNNAINSVKNFPVPKLPSQNLLIPNASEKIRIDFTPEMGQNLTATQDIKPGEVLAVEKPYASILLRDYYHTHCSNCFVRNPAMIPCVKCSLLMFCNEKCREESWTVYHEIECEMIPVLLSLHADKTEFLAVRALMIATNQGTELRKTFNDPVFGSPISYLSHSKSINVGKAYFSESNGAVHFLEDNYRKQSVLNAIDRAFSAAILLHVLRGASGTFFRDKAKLNVTSDEAKSLHFFTGNLLLKYICVAMSNSHPISELSKETAEELSTLTNQNIVIGEALYPLLSLANHSCDPNIARHSHHNYVVVRAIQPIAVNEQIFDNYGYHYAKHDLETRRIGLARQYFFKCTCTACKFEWPLLDNLRSRYPRLLHGNVCVEELHASSTNFRNVLIDVKLLKLNGALESLCPHLYLLHKSIQRPSIEYFECQEAIKECFAFQGNAYVPLKDGTIMLPLVN